MAINVKFKKIITQLSQLLYELNQQDFIELRYDMANDTFQLYNVETNKILEEIKAPMNMNVVD